MRTVEEWRGRTDDSMPTDACKDRILRKQGDRCALTGHEFRPGDKIEFDHITPLWLGGENRESNLQAVLSDAHKGKTKTEATVRAKVNANRLKHLGVKSKSGGFQKRFKKKMNGDIVDTRTGEIVSR
jgi:5-methylcytosine-specific restriction endonuclease McrA